MWTACSAGVSRPQFHSRSIGRTPWRAREAAHFIGRLVEIHHDPRVQLIRQGGDAGESGVAQGMSASARKAVESGGDPCIRHAHAGPGQNTHRLDFAHWAGGLGPGSRRRRAFLFDGGAGTLVREVIPVRETGDARAKHFSDSRSGHRRARIPGRRNAAPGTQVGPDPAKKAMRGMGGGVDHAGIIDARVAAPAAWRIARRRRSGRQQVDNAARRGSPESDFSRTFAAHAHGHDPAGLDA